jgi:hypothetical protein
MTPRAWQPRPLQPGGQALHARLTGRQMQGTAPAPQPQPLAPVVADLTGEDGPGLADLAAMHAPGHPHMTGADPHAEHIPLPDNELAGP